MSVTQWNDFNYSDICYEGPIKKGKRFEIDVTDSNDELLYIQFPRMELLSHDTEKCEMVYKISENKFKKFIVKLEEHILKIVNTESNEWFNKVFKKETLRGMLESVINTEELTVTLRYLSDDIEIFNQKQKPRRLENVKIGSSHTLIVNIKSIYIASKSFGVNMPISHIEVYESRKRVKGYIFKKKQSDDSSDDEVYNNIIESYVNEEK